MPGWQYSSGIEKLHVHVVTMAILYTPRGSTSMSTSPSLFALSALTFFPVRAISRASGNPIWEGGREGEREREGGRERERGREGEGGREEGREGRGREEGGREGEKKREREKKETKNHKT